MEVKHKGQTILYREDSNEWFCSAIGVKPSLKAMKTAIDNLSRKDRQMNVLALMLEQAWKRGEGSMELVEVKVGTLCEPTKSFSDKAATVKECWITRSNKERSKVSIHRLYPLDARDKLEDYCRRLAEAEKAKAAAQDMWQKITQHTADSIAALAKAEA